MSGMNGRHVRASALGRLGSIILRSYLRTPYCHMGGKQSDPCLNLSDPSSKPTRRLMLGKLWPLVYQKLLHPQLSCVPLSKEEGKLKTAEPRIHAAR